MSQQNNESNSKALNLESLNTEYKTLLIEYKQAVSNYVNYLKQELNPSSLLDIGYNIEFILK